MLKIIVERVKPGEIIISTRGIELCLSCKQRQLWTEVIAEIVGGPPRFRGRDAFHFAPGPRNGDFYVQNPS